MQYQTGNNPHEPTDNNTNSRCWLFIIRRSRLGLLPRAWEPHINFCCWIVRDNPDGTYFIRGVFQTTTPRNYYTLKSRYCKQAEWMKIGLHSRARINEITQGPLPNYSRRHWYGLQVTGPTSPVVTIPLHRIGYNIPNYPDLTEDYILAYDLQATGHFDDTMVDDGVGPDLDSDDDDDRDYSSSTFVAVRNGRVIYQGNSSTTNDNDSFYR